MRGLIWYKNKNEGLKKLEHLICQYEMAGIKVRERKNSFNPYVIFENDDYWTLVSAAENSRGYRCNISYIERAIDFETYATIIARTTKDFPYHCIACYGEGDLHSADKREIKSGIKCEIKIDEYANRPFKGK